MSENQTAVTVAPPKKEDIMITPDAWRDSRQARHLFALATQFAASNMVPDHFKNKPQDIMLVLQMAARAQFDPLQALQNISVVKGKPTLSATFQISLANASGVFKGRIKFKPEGEGENLRVTAYAALAEDGEIVTATVSMKTAIAEGWTKNEKYRSMPVQMLSYRAATFLIRLYAPDALLGMKTPEEVIDAEIVETEKLTNKIEGAKQ